MVLDFLHWSDFTNSIPSELLHSLGQGVTWGFIQRYSDLYSPLCFIAGLIVFNRNLFWNHTRYSSAATAGLQSPALKKEQGQILVTMSGRVSFVLFLMPSYERLVDLYLIVFLNKILIH